MDRKVLIVLAFCAFAAAMVPRDRRAVPEEEQQSSTYQVEMTSVDATTESRTICAPQTPCFWTIYKKVNRMIDFNLTNSYCICGAGTSCVITEDDTTISTYIYRCRTPEETGVTKTKYS